MLTIGATPVSQLKEKSQLKLSLKKLFNCLENTIDAYKEGYDTSIDKAMYNTLNTELKNIKKIIGKEIK